MMDSGEGSLTDLAPTGAEKRENGEKASTYPIQFDRSILSRVEYQVALACMQDVERDQSGMDEPMISNLRAGSRKSSFCSGVVCDCSVLRNMDRWSP